MMKNNLILAIVILPLAACGGGGANNASPQAPAVTGAAAPTNVQMSGDATVEGGLTMQPGLWEVRATLDEINMPGAPPGAVDQMKQSMAGRVEQTCFTPEDVANMGRRMFEASNEGMTCTFTNQVFGGGRVDVAGTCRGPQATVEMTMEGTYTETSMQTRNVFSTTAGGQTIRMVATSNGQRVGECPAGGATAAPKE